MKGKNVYIVAAVAIILSVIVLLVEKPFTSKTEKRETPENFQSIKRLHIFNDIDLDDLEKIEISKFDGRSSATLTKADGIWYVDPVRKFEADERLMDRIFESMEQVEESDVISRNPKNHIRFQVDKMTGTRVKFYAKDGKLLEDVILGKMGSNYASPGTFARRTDSDEVVSVKGYFMGVFQPEADNWRNRRILQLDAKNIAAFTLSPPDEEDIRIARLADEQWISLSPERIDVEKSVGDRMANAFARLYASDFVNDYPIKPLEEYGLGPEAFSITAVLKDHSSTPTLYIGSSTRGARNQYYCRLASSDKVHIISEYSRGGMMISMKELSPTPTPIPLSNEEKLGKEIQDKVKRTKDALKNMTEEEKQEALQKQLQDIVKKAEEEAE